MKGQAQINGASALNKWGVIPWLMGRCSNIPPAALPKKWYTDVVGFNINANNAQQSQDPDEKTLVQIPGFL